MAGKNGAGNTRRILILIIAVCDAVSTAALALFHDSMERGLAVALGYAILFLTATLMNFCIAGKATSIKEISALVFSIVLLALVISAIAFILFNADDDTTPMFHAEEEERPFASHPGMGLSYNEDDTAEEEEDVINIPTPPTVFNTITIDKVANDIPEPSEILITERDDEIMIPSVPEVFGMVRDVDRESEVSIPSEPEVFGLIRDAKNTEEPVVIPSVPEMFGVIREVEKESEPEVAPEVIPVDESEIIDIYEPTRPDLLDDDFWSTFYIAGNDEFILSDGLYYMDLLINGENVGTIATLIEGGKASISSEEFRYYIEGNVIEEVLERIFADNSKYIPIEYLSQISIPAVLDSNNYTISITFSANDMPVQIISIRSTGTGIARRPIAGAENINPAVFYIASRYSLNAAFRLAEYSIFRNSLDFSFSSYNTLRLYDIYGNFNYYMDWGLDWFRFRFGTYSFYTDFPDSMIRLKWGNIDSELLSPSGTSFGVGFEKSLSYAKPGTISKSHIERMLIIEKESDVQILNEGREIYRRTLQPGNYRLRDFVLYTGANRIRIIITPLDGSESKEIDIDLNYSSSLLAPGEIYFGAALVSSRKSVSSSEDILPGAFRIPVGGGRSLEYDFRNLVLSGYINAGITTSLTMDIALALQNSVTAERVFNPNLAMALELTHANVLGTTRYSFRVTERTESGKFVIPDMYARVGHQVYFDSPYFNSLSLTATYSGDIEDNSISGSVGFSGRIGILSWGLNGYISSDLRGVDGLSWSASNSYSLSLGRSIWLSGSVDLTGRADKAPAIGGRISATFRFGAGSATASYNNNYSSLTVSAYDSKNNFSARLDTNNLADINAYGFDADYSHTGRFVNAGVTLDADDVFRNTRMSLSLSTSTLFADGLFTMASTIPSDFLLIKQKGILKDNELSIGNAGSSSSAVLPNVFGSYLYTGLSSSRNNALSIYSTAKDSFASSEVFDVNLLAGQRKGFVLKLEAEETYTVSAIVYVDGTLWRNGASPIYRVSEDESGNKTYESTDLYLFTDNEGRFIVSGLYPGVYAFDVPSGNEWYSYSFSVGDNPDSSVLVHVFNSCIEDAEIPAEPYSLAYHYTDLSLLSNEEFWLMLYPEMEEAI